MWTKRSTNIQKDKWQHNLRTDNWLFFQLLPLRRDASVPVPAVLRLSVPISPSPSGIWFLIFLHDGQWYTLCFSVPSSVSQPRHFSSSDHPLSYNLLCTHPPSTTSFLITLRCLSVHPSSVFPQHSLAWLQPHSLSTPHTREWLHKPSWLVFTSIFFTSCVQTTLISTATHPSNSKVCRCGQLIPKSRVSHMTAPAGPLTCFHRLYFDRSASSTPSACFPFSICPSTRLPPWPW